MSGQHARLSASAAHRWMNCQGSVALSEGKGTTSFYAAEGTFAHDIAAKCLLNPSVSPSDFLLKKAKVDGFDVECGLEMIDAVRAYVDYINDGLKEGDQVWVEMPLVEALRGIDRDLGGTADHVRYRPSEKTLTVTDFKYGSGTFVEADDNSQLKMYALGALMAVAKPTNTVKVVIAQPRFEGARPIREWSFPAVEILDFAADVTEAAAKTRSAPGSAPPLTAGEHCKFCPAAARCPELEKRQMALLKADMPIVPDYDVKAVAESLALIPLVKQRINALEEFAYQEANRGVTIPGWKLVEKRPVRKWKSEGEVIVWAQERAIDPWKPREVISPAQMETKLKETAPRGKKKEAGAAIEPFVERVSSGTTLVQDDDERPAVQRISKDDFAAIGGTAEVKQQPPVNLF